jgi:hypothetical protein
MQKLGNGFGDDWLIFDNQDLGHSELPPRTSSVFGSARAK